MRLETKRRPKSQALSEDYVQDFSKVGDRFDYSPWELDGWRKRVRELDEGAGRRVDRSAVADILLHYNEGMGADEKCLESIQRLRDPQTLVVAGGQQAGLFTGPLLVIHKAVTIIRAAREWSDKLKRPVVPVFWIAGEDHDFDEVNHWYALTPTLNVEKWKLEHPTGIRTSISRLHIDSWTEAVAQMDEWLTPSEFKPEIMERLRTYAEQSTTLTELFARIMAWLFSRHGLILLDSDHKELRRVESPFFQELLVRSEEINASLLQGKMEVQRLGYAPQAEVAEGSLNLFFFDDRGERVLLHREEGVISDRKRLLTFDQSCMEELIRTSPERFSNNVMTRPLMQDYVLPVLAVVLGPGEIAYWALTKEAFSTVGMRMPVVLPRLEFTLVEGTIQKNMEKFGLSYVDVMDRFVDKREAWLAEQDQLKLEDRFHEVKRGFEELYRPVLDLTGSLNPGLAKLGETNKQKILEQIDFLQGKAVEAYESKFSSGLRQMDRVRASLAPLSKPQERVYNVFAYLNKYGMGWVEELLTNPYDNDGQHRLVYF